jgi:hypothetical protein
MCYEVAFHFMVEHPLGKKARLVHGKVRNAMLGKKNWTDHAWVEVGDLVWDNAYFDDFVTKDIYYHMSDAHPEKVYTRQGAIKMALKCKHYGEWHTGKPIGKRGKKK